MTEHLQTHGYDLLSKAFRREGTETCFALLGDANMFWGTRLGEEGCRMIYVRHEHCALAAAMAYARKRQDVGVASVTCGPGLTQLTTALPAAVRARLPVVVFAGEAPLSSGWYNQGIEQRPIIEATGATYHALHHPQRMAVAVRDAFLQARVERRPVVLGVPMDLQNQTVDLPEHWPLSSLALQPSYAPLPPAIEDIEKHVALLENSQRVIILAGLGVVESGAAKACRRLAELLGGFLATTLPARGLFHDDPYCIGISGSFTPPVGLELMADADLLIAVGCSLAFHAGGGGQLWPNARTLQIDLAPAAVNQGQTTAQDHIRADARLGVEALIAALSERKQLWRNERWAERIRCTPPDDRPFDIEPGLLDPRAVVDSLESHLPLDWEIVNSSGHCSHFFAHMPSRPQERFLTIREFGAIGNGTSFAMGVAVARPERPVVLLDGDGSLLMHVQELETIIRNGLKILIIVMNDGAFGSEIHKLRARGFGEEGAVFGHTDLAAIARGFGLDAVRVNNLDEIPELVDAFNNSSRAALWDFHVSDRVVSQVLSRAHSPKK